MKLYFENSRGKQRVIAEVSTLKAASKAINDFLDDHNFKSYYTRMMVNDDGDLWYDVGSHTEFFILKELSDEAIKELTDNHIYPTEKDKQYSKNKERLQSSYELIASLHANVPELRIGQLMHNFEFWLGNKKEIDMFYIDDNDFISLFSEFCVEVSSNYVNN